MLSGKHDEKGKVSSKEQFDAFNRDDELTIFTEDDLADKWKEFVKTLDNRPNIQSTLREIPKLEDDFILRLEVDNTIQRDIIETIRPDLIAFLRRELRNARISLKVNVSEVVKSKIIYTSTDKFKEMAKKNPALLQLKKKFRLDFE